MNIVNDSSCNWINDLEKKLGIKSLTEDKTCDWLIVGVSTLFDEQISMRASNHSTKEIKVIENINKPTWLPPEPFLNIGGEEKLTFEKFRLLSKI